MFESLIWMFKVKDFKKHFFILLFSGLGFVLLSVLFWVATVIFMSGFETKQAINIKLINIAVLVLPFLFVTGYFWMLTENIICRDDDITADSIYKGKYQFIHKIKLPELNFLKIMWRGIASIVATALLYLPFSFFFASLNTRLSEASEFWNWDSSQNSLICIIIAVFCIIFIPGLLWNYARRDSVVAVWNVPKAVYIMGNYTGRYIWNTFLFIIFSFVYPLCVQIFIVLSSIKISELFSLDGSGLTLLANTEIILPLIITFFVGYSIGIYWLFVNAYLLGTIAPSNEF